MWEPVIWNRGSPCGIINSEKVRLQGDSRETEGNLGCALHRPGPGDLSNHPVCITDHVSILAFIVRNPNVQLEFP